MIPHSKFEDLYNQVGGVFKTTVLIQKRLRELNRGARRLVDGNHGRGPIEIVMEEIRQKRIDLIADTEENREMIREEELRRMNASQSQEFEVPESATSEDELERRIMNALAKDSG